MDEAGEDVGDVPGPGLPVFAVAAFLDDPGVERIRRQIERREGQVPGIRDVHPVAAEDDAVGRRVVEVDPVDLGIEAVVVRAQRAQHAPDRRETLVVVERVRRIDARRHGDRQHDVAVFLALGLAHGAADGLHDVDLGVARTHEEHGVEGRHVDALREAARVGEDAAGAFGAGLEPFDPRLAFERVVLPVHMAGLATEGVRRFRQPFERALDDVGPMGIQPLRRGDGVGEGDGARQGAGGAVRRALVLRVPQGAPAADDLGRVGDVDLAVRRRQMRLQGRGDETFGHGEDHDLVVGKQVPLDGAGERQAMELRPVGRRVVHREHVGVVAGRLRLGAFGVEARRRGHVEALRGAYPLRVVHQHEGRGLVAGALHAGRPVGFVAQHNIECRSAAVLRLRDDGERLVGAEDHRHRVRSRLAQRQGNRRRVGGDGDLELLERGVLVVAPGARVRTDADVAVRERLLLGPFAHGLREQRNRRHQIEHPPADAGDLLRDAQRGEGLARPAGHDQLAAVVLREAGGHVVERGALMRAQAIGFAPEGEVFRFAMDEVRPVERAAREIAEAQHGTCRLERCDGLDGVRPPPVAGIDDDAGRERVAGRGGDEGVEVGLRYPGIGGVALALDGAEPALALFGDEIDAGVGGVEAGPRTHPFGPQPDVGEALPVERVLDEVPFHQPLEEAPLTGLGVGDGPYVVQHRLKAVVQALPFQRIARGGFTCR